MKKAILVTKASGRVEPFSIKKLRTSLARASTSQQVIDSIVAELMPKLYEGISTKKIYSEAFRMLRGHSKHHAARYYLKKGIMELGPSGFPFEKFMGRVFEAQEFQTEIDQFIKGHCVSHEVDIVARKGNEIHLVECKYRNSAGMPVDVKTPLYIYARFADILDNGSFKSARESVQGWIATNSKFTSDAIEYAQCKQLKLISWDYPKEGSLREIIDHLALYPLTCLTSITKQEKQWLLARNIVLAKEVLKNTSILSKAGLTAKRIQLLEEEGKKLCDKN